MSFVVVVFFLSFSFVNGNARFSIPVDAFRDLDFGFRLDGQSAGTIACVTRLVIFAWSIKFGYTLMVLMLEAHSFVQSIVFGWKVLKKPIRLHSIHLNGLWYTLIARPCGEYTIWNFNIYYKWFSMVSVAESTISKIYIYIYIALMANNSSGRSVNIQSMDFQSTNRLQPTHIHTTENITKRKFYKDLGVCIICPLMASMQYFVKGQLSLFQ